MERFHPTIQQFYTHREPGGVFYPKREIRREIEQIQITPETLMVDNNSDEAQRKNDRWEDNRRRRLLTIVKLCGDARGEIPEDDTVSVPFIAAGGSNEPFIALFNHRSIRSAVILGHGDDDTFIPGKIPDGCGGLGAKANGVSGEEGVARYVKEEITHDNVVPQVWEKALNAAEKTDKPVLAAVQGHLTGIIYPVAAFLDHGETIITAISPRYMFQRDYNTAEIYKDGIPTIDRNKLPDELVQFLNQTDSHQASMHSKYSDYRRWQKVQNPRTVSISTAIRSLRTRYPEAFQLPGSAFQLRVPRTRMEGSPVINERDLGNVLDQAEYPIAHSVANHGTANTPFSAVERVLIETGDIKLSEWAAEQILSRKWMQEWLHIDSSHHLLIGETTAGVTDQIYRYK